MFKSPKFFINNVHKESWETMFMKIIKIILSQMIIQNWNDWGTLFVDFHTALLTRAVFLLKFKGGKFKNSRTNWPTIIVFGVISGKITDTLIHIYKRCEYYLGFLDTLIMTLLLKCSNVFFFWILLYFFFLISETPWDIIGPNHILITIIYLY